MRKHNNAAKSPKKSTKMWRGHDEEHTVLPIIATAPQEGYLVEKNEPGSLWPVETTMVRGVTMPWTDHSPSVKRNQRTKEVRTFADDAAANAFGASPVATSLKPRPRALQARMRMRTQNAPTFCDRSHSLTVQKETARRAFENTISVATRPDTLRYVEANGL